MRIEELTTLTILPEIEALLFPLREGEFATLEANILADGIRDALVVWRRDGQLVLVDGHHRYRIAREHKLPFQVIERGFDDLEAAQAWVDENQLGRRNLLDVQRAEVTARIYKRRKKAEGRPKGGEENGVNSTPFSGSHATVKAIAAEMGVSEKTVRNASAFSDAVAAVRIMRGDVGDALTYLAPTIKRMPELVPELAARIAAGATSITKIQREIGQGVFATVSLPTGKYRTIVIDPPWPMKKILRAVRPNQVEFDYPTMTLEEIEALPIGDLANEEGCHVYLWVTQKYLPAGLRMFELWGVRYQCLMTWVKNVGFTPFSWMYSTEHVLFGRVGNLDLRKMGLRLDFAEAVNGHSRKPEVFYQRVCEASPGPRLEMFARRERDGFVVWGNEV